MYKQKYFKYKQKYFKYKQKYLNYKKLIILGTFNPTFISPYNIILFGDSVLDNQA